MSLILPQNYDPHMTVRDTQDAIKFIRDTFQKEFGREMNLERISAPLFVDQASGLNDNLNGVERPVQFDIKAMPGQTYEVVQSLAKWKRSALKRYGFEPGEGLYTNMNAIRRDEDLDNLHSCYVDQWDWEYIISKKERNVSTLKSIVKRVYEAIRNTEVFVNSRHPEIKC
ncbi:MAG: aspartate--ammonia ligase, partial [Eubacteriales bacterium]